MVNDNICIIRERLRVACAKVHRDPAKIILVGVTKNRAAEQVKEIIDCGVMDIGENRVQEAMGKYPEVANPKVRWHLIGHLQSNKVKDAVKIFDLIHSVESLRLAEEIDKFAAKINKTQDILLEVKTSLEATKSGILPEDLEEKFKAIAKLNNISIKGLMTIAPLADDPEEVRSYFRQLRELRDNLGPAGSRFILSMGMTDDFEVAVEEGADMVRIGRAIFGEVFQ
jgi:PLP dependent protein